ncbi:MAG: S1 RNA-binding domain-containing protein [Chitinivibrionia bacterium]|nr:S1 RNA-binding domain-containing protein [Chitinivibrionia bacterium]
MSDGKAVSKKEELTSAQEEQMAEIKKLDSQAIKKEAEKKEEGSASSDEKKSKSGKAPKAQLREMAENKTVVSGTVTGVSRGGLKVKVLGHDAFCPISQLDTKKLKPEDLNSYLKENYEFVITGIEKGTNVILSRIPLVAGDVEGRVAEIEAIVKGGGTISGTVSGILMDKSKKEETGAFVDLDGVEGLVHISELSWTRAANVRDVVEVGKDYTFKVISVERKDPLTATKVKLSLKQVGNDPWKDLGSQLKVGQKISGIVSRTGNNGAFVCLKEGIEALIRTEDLSWEKFKKISDIVKKGDEVNAKIINIDLEKRRVDLSLKDENSDPWTNITSKYQDGMTVKGTVADEKEYGYFIDIEAGITGLLNKARIAGEKGKKDKLWKKGEEVEVVVQYIDTEERKIVLSFGEVELAPMQKISDQPKKKRERTDKSSSKGGGAPLTYDTAKTGGEDGASEFANLLQNAIDKKKKKK